MHPDLVQAQRQNHEVFIATDSDLALLILALFRSASRVEWERWVLPPPVRTVPFDTESYGVDNTFVIVSRMR